MLRRDLIPRCSKSKARDPASLTFSVIRRIQIFKKRRGLTRRAAPLTGREHANHPDDALLFEGQHIARAQKRMGLFRTLAIQAKAFASGFCGQGAGFEKPRMP